jgi:acyl-CoA reductase-like NAD-dependent aldehyde dehydrogenase
VDQGYDPRTGRPVGDPVPHTSSAEIDRLATAAAAAAPALAPLAGRSDRLRAVAAALEAAREELVAVADAETALGPARLNSELTRARVQFEMFAAEVDEGSFLDIVIDRPDPHAQPAPRPDLRRMLVPIGPVAVYAASNFPFAFSVAGGDTASALAAGCPVIVKAHPGHPQTSVLSARVIATALREHGAPEGTFAVVHGFEAGRELVQHPAIRAAAFTGSVAGGRALFDLAQSRPDPIPFYGELGSLNPTVVTPGALASRASEIVTGFVGSYLLGSGQFCTKPGLLFLPEGHGLDAALAEAVAGASVGPVLGERIHQAYGHGVARLAEEPNVRAVVAPAPPGGEGYAVAPSLFAVSAATLIERRGPLLEECFGPTALIVEYGSTEELFAALDVVPGSLTTTVHADAEAEPELVRALLDRAAARSGRVIWSGWPTGVAVTAAQHHGGPWPATTAPLHTSVGTAAMRRFLRPVVYQSVPDALLPVELRDANPLGLPRRVNEPTPNS